MHCGIVSTVNGGTALYIYCKYTRQLLALGTHCLVDICIVGEFCRGHCNRKLISGVKEMSMYLYYTSRIMRSHAGGAFYRWSVTKGVVVLHISDDTFTRWGSLLPVVCH